MKHHNRALLVLAFVLIFAGTFLGAINHSNAQQAGSYCGSTYCNACTGGEEDLSCGGIDYTQCGIGVDTSGLCPSGLAYICEGTSLTIQVTNGQGFSGCTGPVTAQSCVDNGGICSNTYSETGYDICSLEEACYNSGGCSASKTYCEQDSNGHNDGKQCVQTNDPVTCAVDSTACSPDPTDCPAYAGPDYSLSAAPTSQSVTQGNPVTYIISMTPQSGYNGAVSLSIPASGAYSCNANGVTCSISPSTISPGNPSATLTISTTLSTPTNIDQIEVDGTDGTDSHSTDVGLVVMSGLNPGNSAQCSAFSLPSTVTAGAPFSVSATMTNNGTNAWVNQSVNPTHFYDLSVVPWVGTPDPTVNWTGSGILDALPSSPIASGGSAAFSNMSIVAPTTPGSYTLSMRMLQQNIAWFGGTCSKSVTVVPASAGPTITGVSVSCTPASIYTNQTSACTATVTGTGSFSSAVTWSVVSGGGSIDSSGNYTAPGNTASVVVQATSQQDPTQSGNFTIQVTSPPPATHDECIDNACTSVAGSGPNRCTTDADCGGGPPGNGATHGVCDPSQNACVNVTGVGPDTCTDVSCGSGGLTQSHFICQNDACLSVPVTVSGTACSSAADCVPPPAPTCSLTPNPPQVIPPEQTTLSWNCTNAISCTVNGMSEIGHEILSGNTLTGSTSESPTQGNNTYVLFCTNGAGVSVTSTVSVGISNPGVKETNP